MAHVAVGNQQIEPRVVRRSHLYFEYSVVGYFRRGLELLDETVRAECVEGFSKGDPQVY